MNQKKMDEAQKKYSDETSTPGGFALFAKLIGELGTLTGTNDKLHALVRYFTSANDKDKVWLIALFSGRRPKRPVNSTLLRVWAAEIAAIPQWLFDECYHVAGDLAETIALIVRETGSAGESHTLSEYMTALKDLENRTEAEKKAFITYTWQHSSATERFVFNKLITGSFRIGVSKQLMINALARASGVDPSILAHRLSGSWDPFSISFEELVSGKGEGDNHSQPYPFCLAYPVEENPESLGAPEDWYAEWKWDGIRGQLIKRNSEWFVWSRGEELLTEKFPELYAVKDVLPDGTVLDGEILIAREGKPLPFSLLQTRIGRKNLTKKQLQEAPVSFFAFDLLEWQGQDIRETSFEERRRILNDLFLSITNPSFHLSAGIEFNDWAELAAIRDNARNEGSEGLMLKRKQSVYQVGRKRGDWWKWKIDPLTIDAVMIYAQKGHGRRSNLYSDYTFAVRDGDTLVPFAKAYSGLTDKEISEVDAFVKRNSIEKFGPVRTVKPELVFEIAFEGIAESKRHKSGVALRFPRMNRWRKDKTPADINTLEELKQMLTIYGNPTGGK